MTFKKMLLVASMALAAIAFAAPASASALEWTDEGEPYAGEASDTLSGKLSFGNPAAGQSKFGCTVHAGVSGEGGSSTGTLTSFNVTTSTCAGEGAFATCKLKEDSTTGLPAVVHITGTNTLTITGPIVIHNHYEGCGITKSTLTISDATLTLTNSAFTVPAVLSGLLESHTTDVLGNETTQTVAAFGSLTGSSTLSVS
jgi:hypothetical protein